MGGELIQGPGFASRSSSEGLAQALPAEALAKAGLRVYTTRNSPFEGVRVMFLFRL
jgi:hypothetical protein